MWTKQAVLLLQFHYHLWKKIQARVPRLYIVIKSCLVCVKPQDAAQNVTGSVPEQR